MRHLVSRVEVGDREIKISGPHASLADGVLDSGSGAAGVPSFVQGWWARQDSNLQPDRYERPALTIEQRARGDLNRAATAAPRYRQPPSTG